MSAPTPETRYSLPELIQMMRTNHLVRIKLGGIEIEAYPTGFISPPMDDVKPSMEKGLAEGEMPKGPDLLFMSATNPFTSDEPVENPFLTDEPEAEVNP